MRGRAHTGGKAMRRVLLVSVLALVAGCKGRTELVFGFATDLKAKGQIDRIDFRVYNAQADVIQIRQGWDLADVPAGLYELPGSFGVFTDNGAEPQLKVDLIGSLAGQEQMKREAILSPVAGKTLFMRLTLVGECNTTTGTNCPGGQSCVEGVCRAPETNNKTLPAYVQGMEGKIECNSGTTYILSSTGTPLPATGTCGASQFCQEGTCYENPPGVSQAIGSSDWLPTPTPISTTVHGVFTTPEGDAFAVGEHGVILHAVGGNVLDETFDPTRSLYGIWGTSATDLWAVGSGGVVLHRTAAGWALDATAVAARLSAVWGIGGELWAIGRGFDGAAVVLHRAGGSWRADDTAAAMATGELTALWGSGRNDVWAVGAGFQILHWDGMLWKTGPAAPAGVTADLLAVGGSGRGDVYFVGRGGVIAHLGLDGQLAVQDGGNKSDLYGVWASGPGDVYLVGDYGLILHSAGDGTWGVQESGTREPLFAIDGTGPANVFAVGRIGTLLHFGTGGGMPPDMAPPGHCAVAADCGTSCTAGMLTLRGCDNGQCSDLPPAACTGGFQCGTATACANSCAADADCQADFYCDSTAKCQPRKAQGVACNADAGGECKGPDCRVCRDGFYCTDHVCCDKPAAQCGGCAECKLGSGTCGPVAATKDPHNFCPASGDECQAAACNGSGSCAKPNATACGVDMCSGNQLTKHACSNGVCTAATPTTCAAGTNCATDGKTCLGKCSVDSDCTQGGVGSFCDTNGDCQPRKAAAGTCAATDCKAGSNCQECQNGLSCADGVCCNTAGAGAAGCSGQCEACNIAGFVGSCHAVLAGDQPKHGALCAGAGTPTCGGFCNGTTRTACAVPSTTIVVTKATCASRGSITPAQTCDGAGGVKPMGAAAACAGMFACSPSGSATVDDQCLQKCADVRQCAADTLACESLHCGLPDGTKCDPVDPKQCASQSCPVQVQGNGVCCDQPCNQCQVVTTPNGSTNYMPACDSGKCTQGASCGHFGCDANARCNTACKCPAGQNVCKNDGRPGNAAECIPGAQCDSDTSDRSFKCR